MKMSPWARVLLLIAIMAALCLVVGSATISVLYQAAIDEEEARLEETVKGQARLIEAIARFNSEYSQDYPGGPRKATLSQIMDAHGRHKGFGETGEITLSQLEGNRMVFLLSHRHGDRHNPKPVPLESELAEPMRLALSGRSGTIVGLDYRGRRVLAAYEPVQELGLGIVAKIDLGEIRAPFRRAAGVSSLIGLIATLIGSASLLMVTEPLLRALTNTVKKLQAALDRVKQLGGLLPICASCKKIRDDKGYWNQLEAYITTHTDAEFSHGMCPDCIEKLYPDIELPGGGDADSAQPSDPLDA